MSWSNIAEFKLLTGIQINDNTIINDVLIQKALDAACEEIRQKFFIKCVYRSQTSDTKHFLRQMYKNATPGSVEPIPFADYNADKILNSDDLIKIIEIDQDFNEYDLRSFITTFNSTYGVLNFSVTVPTATNRTVIVEYFIAKDLNNIMQPFFEEINRILAVNWLFKNISFEKLQCGITSWSLNGVNVQFDLDAMMKIQQANDEYLKKMVQQMAPVYVRGTTIGLGNQPANPRWGMNPRYYGRWGFNMGGM